MVTPTWKGVEVPDELLDAEAMVGAGDLPEGVVTKALFSELVALVSAAAPADELGVQDVVSGGPTRFASLSLPDEIDTVEVFRSLPAAVQMGLRRIGFADEPFTFRPYQATLDVLRKELPSTGVPLVAGLLLQGRRCSVSELVARLQAIKFKIKRVTLEIAGIAVRTREGVVACMGRLNQERLLPLFWRALEAEPAFRLVNYWPDALLTVSGFCEKLAALCDQPLKAAVKVGVSVSLPFECLTFPHVLLATAVDLVVARVTETWITSHEADSPVGLVVAAICLLVTEADPRVVLQGRSSVVLERFFAAQRFVTEPGHPLFDRSWVEERGKKEAVAALVLRFLEMGQLHTLLFACAARDGRLSRERLAQFVLCGRECARLAPFFHGTLQDRAAMVSEAALCLRQVLGRDRNRDQVAEAPTAAEV